MQADNADCQVNPSEICLDMKEIKSLVRLWIYYINTSSGARDSYENMAGPSASFQLVSVSNLHLSIDSYDIENSII